MVNLNRSILELSDSLNIARGKIPGIVHVNKFGRAPLGVQTTITDIWDRANATPTQQIWLAPTAARIHNITSASDNDSDTGGAIAQGDGARTIRIWGLKTWDTKETFEDVIMDGTDGTDTANSYVIIHRMKVLTQGGNANIPVGIINATAAVDGTVTASILVGNAQTFMAIYGIPSTQIAYMSSLYFNVHDSANPATAIETDFILVMNESPDVDSTFFIKKHVGGTISTAQNEIQHIFTPHKICLGPCIFKLQGIASAADIDTSAGFDLIIIDS